MAASGHTSYHQHAGPRRAGKACQNCRGRKVKCTVTQPGGPCQNCLLDNVSCLITRCRRGRKQKDWYLRATKVDRCRDRPLPRHVSVQELFDSTPTGSNTTHETDGAFQEDVHHDITASLTLSSTAAAVLNSMVFLGDVLPGLELLQSAVTPLTPPPEDRSREEMPAWFRPFPKHLSAEDVEYARSKGAFKIPSSGVRNEIIRCYVEYMHPYMPLLDATELLQLTCPTTDALTMPKYSLLLFQCVMFAAAAFVDEATVKQAGYDSLKTMRKAFYQKTIILYDADFESDTLILIQSLLLMSLWSEKPEAHKQGWHWTGIAIFLAQTVGLDRNLDGLRLPPKEKSLRKRVWWCCFMRDRLVSLGMSRPMRIRDQDFDVPLPTLTDFEADSLLNPLDFARDSQNPFEHTDLCKKDTRIQLAEIFIHNVRLCMLIGSILSSQYSTLERPLRTLSGAGDSLSSVMLFPICTQSSDFLLDRRHGDSRLSLLDTMLTEWHDSLPGSIHLAQFQSPRSSPRETLQNKPVHEGQTLHLIADASQPSSVAVQYALLHLSYYSAISALHRPRNGSPESASKVSSSAKHIARICAFLNARSLARYLPVNAITMLVPSIISNVLFIRSRLTTSDHHRSGFAEERETEKARDNLNDLLVSLSALREAYVGADWISVFVDTFFARAGLKVVVSGANACHASRESGLRRRFEVQLQPGLSVSYMRDERGAEAGSDCHTTAHDHGVETAPALPTDPQEMIENATSNADIGLRAERPALNDGRVGEGPSNDETAWHGMFDSSPFEIDAFPELWNIGDIGTDRNPESSFWSSFSPDRLT
ncbi:hypothetical protein PV04_04724 [Phialophora macrospora]|uniref:Zn(2)-C6 fungal-type domain-containing protein n=1 Tax=Phialophora macrospora TaxID=1851006 RepID=A0A0D2FL02_9EURO|nr:hypothetical protein PV04_04724 [Phialophora macrospora]